MTRKKKIILFSLLSMALIVAGYWYSIWSAKNEREKVLKWVESNGGTVEFGYPDWLKKHPEFMQGIIKKVIGEDIIYIIIGEDDKALDLSPLKKIRKIGLLDLSKTSISNFSILKDFTQLKELGVHQYQLSNISSLKGLSQLKVLYIRIRGISVLKVTDKLRKKLNAILPDCEIRFSAG